MTESVTAYREQRLLHRIFPFIHAGLRGVSQDDAKKRMYAAILASTVYTVSLGINRRKDGV